MPLADSLPSEPSQPGKGFSALAVERGYCTPLQIQHAMRTRNRLTDQGVKKELPQILLEEGALSKEQVQALERALRGTTVIAGFELLEKVGQGGMGAVFRARQIAMDRIVALKIPPPKLTQNPSFRERFLREARLSAKLNHLNLVNGIECGESGGYMFFAMEFVEGRTAKALLEEQGKLPLDRCLAIIRQSAEALAYAHRHGLVHRDVKPENIMVTPQGVAKLCDLGLAKQSESGGAAEMDPSLTQSGMAVGTPHYISPEQARGESQVDTRSDIYSLGVTFYHMLTGQPPFDGRSGQNVMVKHLTDEAPGVCERNPDIPAVYGQIVAKMMAKAPAERYPDPQALLDELAAAEAGEAVLAASFHAKSSCAMPRRTAHRTAVPGAGARRSSTGPINPVGGDRTTRVPPTLRRKSQSSTPLVALLAAAFAAVGLFVIFRGGGTRSVRRRYRPKPLPSGRKQAQLVKAEKSATPKAGASALPVAGKAGKKAPGTVDPAGAPVEGTAGIEPKVRGEGKSQVPAILKKSGKPAPETVARPGPKRAPASTKPPTQKSRRASKKARAAYAAFLGEMAARSASSALRQVLPELKALAVRPRFAEARVEVAAELADLQAALRFEDAALKALADEKAEIKLNPARVKQWGQAKGVVEGFQAGRGLLVNVGGAQFPIQAREVDPDQLIAAGKNSGQPDGWVRYLVVRKKLKEARASLPQLPAADRPRFKLKLDLLAKREAERAAKATVPKASKAPKATPTALVRTPPKGPVPQGTVFRDASDAASLGGELCRWSGRYATGVAVGDLNGDGRQDVALASQGREVRVFLNTPQGFRDWTAQSGIGDFRSRTVHICDINADGRPELSFLANGRLKVFLNQGGARPRFQSVAATQRFQFNNTEGSAWMDFDGDGQLDFLAAADPGLHLIHINAQGKLVEVTGRVGLAKNEMRLGNGDYLIAQDLNNDTYTDFVYNVDGGRSLVVLNRNGRIFQRTGNGIVYQGKDSYKIGLAAADINGDGWVDFFVPQQDKPKLFLNNGKGAFRDVLPLAGDLAKTSQWTYSAAFGDLDLDGDQDLVVSRWKWPLVFLNDGHGKFTGATRKIFAGGPRSLGKTSISYLALFDADGDGVLDLFVYPTTGPGQLWLNTRKPSARAAPLRVRFDTAAARTPLGARVDVTDGWGRRQTQWVSGGDGRGGQRSPELIFGVPAGPARVKVTYVGGTSVAGRVSVSPKNGVIARVQGGKILSKGPAASGAPGAPTAPAAPSPSSLMDRNPKDIFQAYKSRWDSPGVLYLYYSFSEGKGQPGDPSATLAKDWSLNGARRVGGQLQLPGHPKIGPVLKVPLAAGALKATVSIAQDPGRGMPLKQFGFVLGQTVFFFDAAGRAAIYSGRDITQGRRQAQAVNWKGLNLKTAQTVHLTARIQEGHAALSLEDQQLLRVPVRFRGGRVGVFSSTPLRLRNMRIRGRVDEAGLRAASGLAPALKIPSTLPVAPAPAQSLKPRHRPDLSGVFKAKGQWQADGSAAWVWDARSGRAFWADWKVDDPRNRNVGEFFLAAPKPGVLAGFKGSSGELWKGKRKQAVLVALRKYKITHFRLEVQYSLGPDSTAPFTAGIGLWDGRNQGLTYGPHKKRQGRLAVWGSLPDEDEYDEDDVSDINKEARGQLAVQADGAWWTFYYRAFNETNPKAWKEVHRIRVSGPLYPAITPWTWSSGKLDYYLHAVRLVILPGDPLLRKARGRSK